MATYDGTKASLYVDNILEATGGGAGPITSTAPLLMGRLNSGNDQFHGVLDAVAVFSRALSASELPAYQPSSYLLDLGKNYYANGQLGYGNSNVNGVLIQDSANNTIGGPAVPNTIALNRRAGVAVSGYPTGGNTIRGNSVYFNGLDYQFSTQELSHGAGILSLWPLPPDLTGAGGRFVAGTLNPILFGGTYTIDFYDNRTPYPDFIRPDLRYAPDFPPDPTGYGQGEFYAGSVTVTSDGHNVASFNVPVGVIPGDWVTATATDQFGNTSAFSPATVILPDPIDGSFGSAGTTSFSDPVSPYTGRPVVSQIKGYHMATQPDGNIVAVGTSQADSKGLYQLVITRFTADGALDPTFNPRSLTPGVVIVDPNLIAGFSEGPMDYTPYTFTTTGGIAVQNDGKIVVVASDRGGDNFIFRFNSDGSLDTSFGATRSEGKAAGTVGGGFSIILGNDFSYPYPWAPGYFKLRFGSTAATGLTILPDGRILAMGNGETVNYDFFTGLTYVPTDAYFVLLETNGNLFQPADNYPGTFRGILETDQPIIPTAFTLRGNSIWYTGTDTLNSWLLRIGLVVYNHYDQDYPFYSFPEFTFNLNRTDPSGTVIYTAENIKPSGIYVDPFQDIVTVGGSVTYVGGYTGIPSLGSGVFALRIANGYVDPSFNDGNQFGDDNSLYGHYLIRRGVVFQKISLPPFSNVAMVVQPDGKTVLAADAYGGLAIARFNSDGSSDRMYVTRYPLSEGDEEEGFVQIPLPGNVTMADGVAFEASGRIVVAAEMYPIPPRAPYPFQTFNPDITLVLAGFLAGPVATGVSQIHATEGAPFSEVAASFVDADRFVTAADFTATIDWGDGQTSPAIVTANGNGSYTISGSHTYAEEGIPKISVHVGYPFEVIFTASTFALVADAPLTATGTSIASAEGLPFSGPLASFTDADPNGTATDYTATIDWGDGSTATAGTISASGTGFVVDGSHTYAEEGSYPATVTILDGGDPTKTILFSKAVANSTATVAIVPPTASISGPTNGVPGQPRTFTFSATDVSPTDLAAGFIYTINWGDGGPILIIPRSAGNGSGVALDHIFTTPGAYLVRVTATEDGGSSGSASQSITVQSVQMQGKSLAVGGTPGNDTIILSPADAVGDINVKLNGLSLGSFLPTDHILVYGQTGNDTIQLASSKIKGVTYYVTVSAFLYGGGQGTDKDILDATGSTANNVLTGGAGSNRLFGGLGRDLLIAGLGTSQLHSGTGEDILIGGWTDYDLSSAAMTYDRKVQGLEAIMTEWGRTDLRTPTDPTGYQARVNDLLRPGAAGTSGGKNGSYYLNSTTVHSSGVSDALFGAGNPLLDWFFASNLDVLKNKRTGEIVTAI